MGYIIEKITYFLKIGAVKIVGIDGFGD